MDNSEVESYEKFEDMNLSDDLLRGIFAYGYEKPSIIQQKAIIQFTTGRDIIAQAQSGTGKTATFTIGMLQKLDVSLNKTQVIILAHTRELASQINHVVDSISKYNCIVYLKGESLTHNGTGFYTKGDLNTYVGFVENRALFFNGRDVYHTDLQALGPSSPRYSLIPL